MDIVRFNAPLDTFLGHFGDGAVTAASARIVAAVSAPVNHRLKNKNVNESG